MWLIPKRNIFAPSSWDHWYWFFLLYFSLTFNSSLTNVNLGSLSSPTFMSLRQRFKKCTINISSGAYLDGLRWFSSIKVSTSLPFSAGLLSRMSRYYRNQSLFPPRQRRAFPPHCAANTKDQKVPPPFMIDFNFSLFIFRSPPTMNHN